MGENHTRRRLNCDHTLTLRIEIFYYYSSADYIRSDNYAKPAVHAVYTSIGPSIRTLSISGRVQHWATAVIIALTAVLERVIGSGGLYTLPERVMPHERRCAIRLLPSHTVWPKNGRRQCKRFCLAALPWLVFKAPEGQPSALLLEWLVNVMRWITIVDELRPYFALSAAEMFLEAGSLAFEALARDRAVGATKAETQLLSVAPIMAASARWTAGGKNGWLRA